MIINTGTIEKDLLRVIKGFDEKPRNALIKINYARCPKVNHPRTDIELLKQVIEFLIGQNIVCCVTEAADGYLVQNLKEAGIYDYLVSKSVKMIDIDNESSFEVQVNNQTHYIPSFFKDYDLRIAVPVASKRENMLFSNQIKLFVGAVPRKFYLKEESGTRARLKLHEDIHSSVANIFTAIEAHTPFHVFISGGNAYDEVIGNFDIPYCISDNAIEADTYILNKYFKKQMPEYMNQLIYSEDKR